MGFRTTDGSVCSALAEPQSARANGGIGCNGARFLRRALAQAPLHLSGGGGGKPMFAHGFARAEVVSLTLSGAGNDGVVALSEPWRPRGRGSTPIRFFYVVMKGEPAGPRAPLLPESMRLEARLADGSVVTLPG